MRGVGRRVGVRGVSDGPRVPLGVCWERRSQPGTCVDGWVPNKCEPRADDDRHVSAEVGSRCLPRYLFGGGCDRVNTREASAPTDAAAGG